MSQIAMTQTERVDTLMGEGFTAREAEFLCLVALHSGYFLRRQYAHFLGQAPGGTVATLVEKLTTAGYTTVATYAHQTLLYHLSTRPFYARLGQSDNRNRRMRQPLTIKNKLMCLDFVLDHRSVRYLSTENEKVAYFSGERQIPPSMLPTKLYASAIGRQTTARYFIEKYPIFLAADGTPTFCFVDEGLTTDSRFDTFLAHYSPLLGALAQFHIIYVAASLRPRSWAEKAFERRLLKMNRHSSGEADRQRLLTHFAERQQYEAREFASFDRVKLMRYRDERAAFSGPEIDALYHSWKTEGDRAVEPRMTCTASPVGTFSMHQLRHNYDLFGTLTIR